MVKVLKGLAEFERVYEMDYGVHGFRQFANETGTGD